VRDGRATEIHPLHEGFDFLKARAPREAFGFHGHLTLLVDFDDDFDLFFHTSFLGEILRGVNRCLALLVTLMSSKVSDRDNLPDLIPHETDPNAPLRLPVIAAG
jgi:hypothetical protein